jgi:hypothetical protein
MIGDRQRVGAENAVTAYDLYMLMLTCGEFDDPVVASRSPAGRRRSVTRSNNTTGSAASSTNISRSRDVLRVAGTHRPAGRPVAAGGTLPVNSAGSVLEHG